MDLYNKSQSSRKKSQIIPSSHGSGKSSTTKRITGDNIHLFLAQQDELVVEEEFAIRKPAALPDSQKKETKHKPETTRAISLQTLPTEIKPQRISKKETKKSSEPKVEQTASNGKYAGGGYTTSPNPKELSKPNLTSPAKKEKKSNETKTDIPSARQSLSQRFTVHSHSTPNLNEQVSFPSHPLNVIPMPQTAISSPNYFNGQSHYFTANPIPYMTREEANQDLRTILNII